MESRTSKLVWAAGAPAYFRQIKERRDTVSVSQRLCSAVRCFQRKCKTAKLADEVRSNNMTSFPLIYIYISMTRFTVLHKHKKRNMNINLDLLFLLKIYHEICLTLIIFGDFYYYNNKCKVFEQHQSLKEYFSNCLLKKFSFWKRKIHPFHYNYSL